MQIANILVFIAHGLLPFFAYFIKFVQREKSLTDDVFGSYILERSEAVCILRALRWVETEVLDWLQIRMDKGKSSLKVIVQHSSPSLQCFLNFRQL